MPKQDLQFHAYVINLPNATQRWGEIRSNLEDLDIQYVRIEAILGDKLSLKKREYNRIKYNISHGKRTNLRQVGCYLSHIKALKIFLESGDEYGLILEDDIRLPTNIKKLIEFAIPHDTAWDLLRLSAHKPGQPLVFADLPDSHALAYNLKVLKNTGAYLVNRHAAQCICEKMLPMSLPYDVALDVEWRYGFKTAYITPLPVLIKYDLPSQIPPTGKIRFFRTTTFHLFHWIRHYQRRLHRKHYFREAKGRAARMV
jgi:glycosyl transferase, family 25